MKRLSCHTLLSFLVSLLMLNGAFCEGDSLRHRFVNRIGVKSGVTFSRMIMRESFSNGPTDYLYGSYNTLYVDVLRHDNIKLITHFGHIRKGGVISTETHKYYIGWKYDSLPRMVLSYLTWSIAVKANFNFRGVVPFVMIGPKVDRLISRYNAAFHPYLRHYEDEIYGYPGFQGNSYGMLAGGGLSYTVGKLLVGIEYQRYVNLNPVIDQSLCGSCSEQIPGRLTNRTFLLAAQVGLKI